MINNKRIFLNLFTMLLLGLFLSGCAGTIKHMQVVPPERVVTAPEKGKSRVVFMRPASLGYAIQSSVFEIKGNKPTLVGIVAAKKKVSYQLEPGKHLFMVVGESADFMSAELKPNKTYYALVSPRMGLWKARFSLEPIHANKLASSQFNKWFKECDWVEKSPASDTWANANLPSILSKYKKNYSEWMSKDSSERLMLFPQDGK